MREIPLSNSPSQSFSFSESQTRWGIRIFSVRGAVCADVDRDGVRVVSGVRVVAGEPIIPYKHLETGNFIITVSRGELVKSSEFGVSQSLFFLNAEDIALAPVLSVGLPPIPPQPLLTDEGFYLTTDDGEILTDD